MMTPAEVWMRAILEAVDTTDPMTLAHLLTTMVVRIQDDARQETLLEIEKQIVNRLPVKEA